MTASPVNNSAASTKAHATTADTSVGARPSAKSSNRSGDAPDFSHLMHLQDRGRKLETSLRSSSANASDEAAKAIAQQHRYAATQLEGLRELVGPTPGRNARHALAAIIGRLEKGGEAQPGDPARIRLAISVDQGKVHGADVRAMRSTVTQLEAMMDGASKQASDPTLVQDADRLADFQRTMHTFTEAMTGLITAAGTGGAAAKRAIASATSAMAAASKAQMDTAGLDAFGGDDADSAGTDGF